MKRIATASVVFCLIAVLHVMGQTTPATTSTSRSKPATPATANSTAVPTSKPAPKAVLFWDGTGTWRRTGGDAQPEKTGAEGADKWPSPTYDEPADSPDREMNATRESGATSQGSEHMLRCAGPERRPCTEGEVRELSRRLAERSQEHPALASINTLTLESSQGAVSCRQVDGARCTREQLRSLNEHVAAPLRCAIYEVNVRSNPQSRTSTEPNEEPANSSYVATTPESTSLTPASTYTAPGSSYMTTTSTATTPGGNSSTQHGNPTGQNHAHNADRRPAEWHHRDPTAQNHTPTARHQIPPPPKQQ